MVSSKTTCSQTKFEALTVLSYFTMTIALYTCWHAKYNHAMACVAKHVSHEYSGTLLKDTHELRTPRSSGHLSNFVLISINIGIFHSPEGICNRSRYHCMQGTFIVNTLLHKLL